MSSALAVRPRRKSFVRSPRSPMQLLVWAAELLVAAIILYPLVRLLASLFYVDGRLQFRPFVQAAKLPGLGQTLINTVLVVGIGGLCALVVASLFAWLNERTDARMGWLSQSMPVIPVLIPPIAMVIGWVLLLAPTAGTINIVLRKVLGTDATQGPLNIYSMPGLIFLYALELLPYAYLVMSSAFRSIDPALEEASRTSGAGPLRTLWKVTLPAVKPALGASSLLMLVMGFALFSSAAIVGTTARVDILSARIVELLQGVFPPKTEEAVALSFVILVVIGLAWLAQARILRLRRFAMVGGKGMRATPVRLGVLKWPARLLMLTYVAAAVALPMLALLYVSLQRFWTTRFNLKTLSFDAYIKVFIEDVHTRAALFDSVMLAVVGATVAMAIAFSLAMLVRRRPARSTTVLDAIAKLPGALSHIVIAVAVLLAFGGGPFFLGGTLVILLIAYVVIYLPQGSVTADSSVSQVGEQLMEASYMAGASEPRTLRRIALPLMLPGLAGGWVLLFVLMAGDLTASVLLSTTTTPTVGAILLQRYQNGSFPVIAALALIITLVSAVIVLTVLRVTRGKVSLGAQR